MAANTDQTRVNLLGRIALLMGSTLELIIRQDGALRDMEMVKRLARALQLFKNNQLGEVQMFVTEPEQKLLVSKHTQDLRTAFRAKIDRLGEYELEEVFAKGLPSRIRNRILYDPSRGSYSSRYPRHHQQQLRKLVALTEEEVIDGTGIGKISLPDFVKALNKEGLSFGMSEGEIEECFGPEKVRVIINLEDKDGKDVDTGMEIAIEASDGKIYRGTSYANGAYFQLPPGECKIIEPKLDPKYSRDGYQRLWLEVRRGEESKAFRLA